MLITGANHGIGTATLRLSTMPRQLDGQSGTASFTTGYLLDVAGGR
ncbi:MAG: hypothetical protein ACK4FZ_03635 [Vogesella sp.]